MQSRPENISYLLQLSLKKELNDRQKAELNSWLQESADNRNLFGDLSGNLLQEGFREMAGLDIAAARERVKARLAETAGQGFRQRRFTFIGRRFYWSVAASIAALIGGVLWFGSGRQEAAPKKELVQVQQDVQPGQQGAILRLANGSTVLLDTIVNATIALQGGVTAKVVNGILMYEGEGSEVVTNSISTPKGRQYRMLLPDGSGVWLNAASTIQYPNKFGPKERVVHITGEAYFDVVKDSKPFRVIANERTEALVLGTSFNINAYEDEKLTTATLLKGAIAVKAADSKIILKPGEQAQVRDIPSGLPVIDVNRADTSKAVAWKNGIFNFNGSGFTEVMRQLERWYDIDVVYEGGVPDIRIGGELSKELSLSQLLKGLEVLGVKFRIEGRQLAILK